MEKYKSFILLFLLLSLILFACSNQTHKAENIPQDPLIQVYFNHRQTGNKSYSDRYRQIQRSGDDLEAIIIAAIDSAQTSIDVAVQELQIPQIAQALAERYQSGVKVRIIVDNNYSRPLSDLSSTEVAKLEQRDRYRYREFFTLVDTNQDGKLSQTEINQGDALIILRNAGVPLIDDTADGSRGSGLMHHKFIIIDGQIILTGSTNFTLSGIHGDFANSETRGNANNLLQIKSSQLAAIFQTEFDQMWGDGVGGNFDSKFGLAKTTRPPATITVGKSTIKVQFSPSSPTKAWENSTNGLIGNTLLQANKLIDLALFVFSEQKLANILEQKQQQGVTVEGVFEPEFALRYYSETLDLLGIALTNKCKYETDNHPWQKPIQTVGIAQLPNGDKLHHKFAVIDNQIVITGSHNWSAAANYNNDEAVLVIYNPTVAAHYLQEFNQLYQEAKLGVPQYLQTKIEKQTQKCS